MPLIDFGKFKKYYRVRVKCNNCGEIQELNIPKGETIADYINSEKALCNNCGCATLEYKGDKIRLGNGDGDRSNRGDKDEFKTF